MSTHDDSNDKRARSGWGEFVGDGIRRDHRTTCPASTTRDPGTDCECPWSWWVPQVGGMPRRRSGPFIGTLVEAREAKRRQQDDAVVVRQRAKRGTLMPSSTATVFEYFGAWMRFGADRWSPATLDSRSAFYRRILHGYFGHLRLRDLTTDHLDAMVDAELRAGRGYRSVEFAFMCMRSMLHHATQRRHIPYNPAAAVILPPPPDKPKRRDYLTTDEYRALVAACMTTVDELFVRLAGEAGLRRGEVAALRVSCFDLAARELTVFKTVVKPRGGVPTERVPKGGKARVVPLTDGLVELLDAYFDGTSLTGDDLLFRQARGDTSLPCKPYYIHTRVKACMVRAGLVRDDDHTKSRFSLHDLRRTAATQARERGVSPEVIRHALGHHRTFVTERHYLRNRTHPELRRFADALQELAEPLQQEPPAEAA